MTPNPSLRPAVTPNPLRRRRLVYVCESGTDVRTLAGLQEHFELILLVRPAFGAKSCNWRSTEAGSLRVVEGPVGRLAFAAFAAAWLGWHRGEYDAVLSQNASLASLAANGIRHLAGAPTFLLICSPNIAYLRCRHLRGELSLPVYLAGRALLEVARAGNALLAEKYLVPSHYLGRETAPGRSEKVLFVPVYGVDTSRYTPVDAAQKRALRARLGLPAETFLIFFSSRVAPEKDTESLLEACVLLEREGRDFRLLNLGGGHRQLLELAARKGLRERVIARDAVSPLHELPAYYQASDVCAQISLEEGLGFSPLEALACGVPVVATAVGGLRETIREGETGLSVPVRAPHSLARALARVMDTPEAFVPLALRGRQMVQEQFEASKAFAQLAAVVEDAVARQETAAPRA